MVKEVEARGVKGEGTVETGQMGIPGSSPLPFLSAGDDVSPC